MFRAKRIYGPPSPENGFPLLVMRLWPRGITKAAVNAREWDLGPSRELRTSFRGGKLGWADSAVRHRQEVSVREELLGRYRDLARRETLTLLCSCQDEARCHRTLLGKLRYAVVVDV